MAVTGQYAYGEPWNLVRAKTEPIVCCAEMTPNRVKNYIRQLQIGDCDASAG